MWRCRVLCFFFFFNDTATTEIYTLSLHDALPICAYISFNNFAVGGGALQVIWSNDGGTTWTAPVTVVGSFVRDVQVTVGADGKVFIATMNEGGGGMSARTNVMQMSTNG